MPGLIYALTDPSTDEVRYVGQTTKTLDERVKAHISSSRRPRFYVHSWIASLRCRPGHFVIEECDSQTELDEAERFWISWYRRRGGRLTNLTVGGQSPTRGSRGRKLSVIERQEIADRNRGNRNPFYGSHHSDAVKAKIAATLKRRHEEGKLFTTQREKISQGAKRQWAEGRGHSARPCT